LHLPRNAQIWLPGYMRNRAQQAGRKEPQKARIWLTIADHWEPFWSQPSDETARQRVALWRKRWPEVARRWHDSRGNHPVYTFFYPQEEYRPVFLDVLAEMAREGIADVDVHIHHDCEGEQNFLERMNTFLEQLTKRHGLLRRRNGKTVFGFIHGNWALDNSRPDGRWCGLNNEITLLRDLGCYADYTMPSGASPTQWKILNTICWVTDDPQRPRSFDAGVPAIPGGNHNGDLLMIPGPMGIRWGERLAPRLETGEIAWQDFVTPYRVKRWLDLAPRPGDDIFIKLYTHGAQERNSSALFDQGGLDTLFRLVESECRRRGWSWYSVSAWSMYRAVDAALRQADPAKATEE
jgi:hypothetical protein